MIRRSLALIALCACAGGPAAAQGSPPYDWGPNPKTTRYALAAPAGQMSELSVEFRDGEAGRRVAVLLYARFVGGGNRMFVEGACVPNRAGYACTLRDGWRAKASLARTADGFTVAFAKPVKFQEILRTGATGRSPYDSDFYFHDVAGTYRLTKTSPR